jgi:hypothetical protein
MKDRTSTKVQIGDWVYHPKTLLVRYRKGAREYEVDLEQCLTPAEMLDWIFQFASKRWVTRESVGDLVTILKLLLHPQATLCSYGKERGPLPDGDGLRNAIAKRLGTKRSWGLEARFKPKHSAFTFTMGRVLSAWNMNRG